MRRDIIRTIILGVGLSIVFTASAMAQQSQAQEGERLEFASQLMGQSQFDQAGMIYEDFITQNPQSQFLANAYLGAGDSHFFLKDYDKALEFYKKYENQFSQGKDKWLVFLREGQCLYMKGKADEALSKLTAINPSDIKKQFLQTYYFYLGESYMDKKNNNEAAANFAKAVEVQTSGGYTAQAYLQWASLLAHEGDANGAFDKYSKAMDVGDSEQVKLQLQLKQGLSYLQDRQYDMASMIFEKIIDGYPTSPIGKNAAVNWFIVLSRTGQTDKMINEYKERFRNDFDDPLLVPIHLLVLEALVNRQQYDDALNITERLTSSPSLSPKAKNQAILQKIRILTEQGNFDDALKVIESQAQNSDDNASLVLLKAQNLIGLKDYDKAWDIYSKLANDSPENADAYCGMANVRQAQGQETQAASLFMDCSNKSKDENIRQGALFSAFLMYTKANMEDKAQEVGRSYQSAYPQGQHLSEITFTLAQSYSQKKQYDKAIEALKSLPSTASYQDQREALFQVAYNLQLAGRVDEAFKLYQMIISQNTDPQLTVMALKNSALIASQKNDQEQAAQAMYLIVTDFPSNDLPTKDYLWLIEHWQEKKDVQKVSDVMDAIQKRPDFNPQSPIVVRAKEFMGNIK
jgi:tetratricopeptide (TPR) repeat protein